MNETKERPITAERIEKALDKLAYWMDRLGNEGEKALPLYERLERELAAIKSRDDKMAAVRDRVTRSKGRTAGTLS